MRASGSLPFRRSATLACLALGASALAAPPPVLRLYALDGGRLDSPDLGVFSDTGEHAGERGSLAVPCFLIRHGKDWLLWDTGLGDRIATLPHGEAEPVGRFVVRRTVQSQLAQLGLKPSDVRYVALSHLHMDHSGNLGLFSKATFLVSSKELAWARGRPTPEGVRAAWIAPLAHARVEASDADRDVFGDGTVRLLRTPGHTPGHRSLLVRLSNAGFVLITGDLFHSRENHEKGLVPVGNVSRADTLASFERFRRIQSNTHARVIVQHSSEDLTKLPTFPKYLD